VTRPIPVLNRPATEPSDDEPRAHRAADPITKPPRMAAASRGPVAVDARSAAVLRPPSAAPRPPRPARLPFARQEIVAAVGARCDVPTKLPRSTADLPGPLSRDTAVETPAAEPAAPASDPDAPRTRGSATDLPPGEKIRTLVFAPDSSRATWIERELTHAAITIQVGRRVRTIVAALVKDPPPRPQVLVVDFDAVSPAELLELYEIRQEGWFGRLIGLGRVPPELCAALGVDHVLAEPLVRDSLLDCVAGTRHAAVTTVCPIMPPWDDRS